MQESLRQEPTPLPKISLQLTKRRLKVFSSIVKEDSPNSKSAKRGTTSDPPVFDSNPTTVSLPFDSHAPPFEPSPPKQQLLEMPLRARKGRYRPKQSVSLLILNVTMEKVQKLQQALAEYGEFEVLDARRLHEGILVVRYFDLRTAARAYEGLQENWGEGIQVEYNFDPKEQLSSINESPDSGGSERSEEGSDSERKAQEALETTKQKLKEEYEKLEDPLPDPLNKTMPVPFVPRFGQSCLSPFNSTCQFPSSDPHGSDTSFDNDTLNEGIEVNYTRQFIPRFFTGIHSTPSTALHTESTNMDMEDSCCKHSYLDSPEMGVPRGDFSFSENLQFLRTQPTKNLLKPPVMHTHTKSYDFAFLGGPLPYIPNYYGEEASWYRAEKLFYPPAVYDMPPYVMETPEKYPGRTKYVETEESKAKYKVSLKDILNGMDARTTLMIKNIPNKYNQKMLLQKIDKTHSMQYNFFYLPIDFKNNCNVGYAFINFVNPLYILKFYEEMNAKKWEKFNSEKVCQITYARIQGLEGLLEHFHCSSVMSHQNKKVKPLILNVPAPTAYKLAEYQKELKETMTEERLKELEELNEKMFGWRENSQAHDS